MTFLWLVRKRSAAWTEAPCGHEEDQLRCPVCGTRASGETFCNVQLHSLKLTAVCFPHCLSNSSSTSHLCTYSRCFSTWFHASIIACFLSFLPHHFCTSGVSVLEHVLPLLLHCPSTLILTPQPPTVIAPLPMRVVLSPRSSLCSPAPLLPFGISYPCSLRQEMRRLCWE